MEQLLELNRNTLLQKKVFSPSSKKVQHVVSVLNTKKIAIVSGMRYSGKIKFLLNMIEKTNSKNDFFYFNKDTDLLGQIQDSKDLETLFELHKRIYGNPKIVILQNISKIQGIKSYIGKLYQEEKYKILIVGNNIKIGGIEEIVITSPLIEKVNKETFLSACKYGTIEEISIIKDEYFKKLLLESISENIISKDAIHVYDIKNASLYYNVLSFLAHTDKNMSFRELHRELQDHNINLSLITLMDYVDISLKTKILGKITKYDIKNSKEIPSKVTYYFKDSGIRNFLSKNYTIHNISLKNTIYNELDKRGYKIFFGVNGRFYFDFKVGNKEKKNLSIHLYEGRDKNEMRKDARKLTKLGDNSLKLLIVPDKDLFKLRKLQLDDVYIIEPHEIIQYI